MVLRVDERPRERGEHTYHTVVDVTSHLASLLLPHLMSASSLLSMGVSKSTSRELPRVLMSRSLAYNRKRVSR